MGGGGVLARSSSLPRTFQVSISSTFYEQLLLVQIPKAQNDSKDVSLF